MRSQTDERGKQLDLGSVLPISQFLDSVRMADSRELSLRGRATDSARSDQGAIR